MSFIAVGIGVAGLAVSTVGAVKAGKAAKDMRKMAENVPTAEKSKYPGLMLATAQNELNANNPFLAAKMRSTQGIQANTNAAAAKAVTDPAMLLSLVNSYNKSAEEMTYQNMLSDEQAREQKVQNLFNAQRAGQQQDQMDYDNQMTAFNSKANIKNAATQTEVGAWQSVGSSLTAVGTTGIKGGGFGKAGGQYKPVNG